MTPPQVTPSPRSGGLKPSEAAQLAATACGLPDSWVLAVVRHTGQLVIEPLAVSERWRYAYVALPRQRVVRALGYSRHDRQHD